VQSLTETNRQFYDALWTDASLIGPERFNTWPLVCSLVAQSRQRLEVAPGLRPRLPLDGTRFVDQSALAVSKLRRHGASAVRGLVTSIPFADGTFDLVCAFDIVEHVADDESALSELSRVAAAGAILLLSVPLHESSWTAFDDLVGHHRRYEPAQLRSQLAAHGFSVEESALFGMKPRSSRLVDFGMWFLTHRRAKAIWWYDRVFMPLGLRFQKELAFVPGMVDADGVDEILIVCRKNGAEGRRNRVVPRADPTSAPVDWLHQRERGAVWAIEVATWVATSLGRPAARILARGIAAYYLLFDGRARRASRDWLTRVHERPPSLSEIYRHISCFAQATTDRLFFARRAFDVFEIERTGNHHLEALARERRGAILLGAHLGSFDALSAASQDERFPVTIVGHFENARRINAVLERLDPGLTNRVLHTGRDPIALALTLRDRLAAGGMIALLADRVGLNDKSVSVDFFGAPARFATGPFLLASILKCPIYLVFGLYREPNRYELFCEPFSERLVLPRGARDEVLAREVSRYARRLEDYCRKAPDNWFNFFDFWETGTS